MEYRLNNLDQDVKRIKLGDKPIRMDAFFGNCSGVIHQVREKYKLLLSEYETNNVDYEKKYTYLELTNAIKYYDKCIEHMNQGSFIR